MFEPCLFLDFHSWSNNFQSKKDHRALEFLVGTNYDLRSKLQLQYN